MIFVVPHGDALLATKNALALAKGNDPLAPVTVVVPSNYAGLSLRARLGSDRPVVNVRFLVLARLAELLGAPRLERRRRPLTAWNRAEAVRAALADHPGIFGDLQQHPSTLHALESTFRDLRRADDGALEELARRRPYGADVVAIYERFRKLTAGYYDPEDLAEAAAAAVVEGAAPLRDVGHVVLYLPRTLSPAEERLVKALRQLDMVDIVFGLAGEDQVDHETSDLAARLGFNLVPGDEGPPKGTAILKAVDVEEEVRSTVRLIMRMAEAGTPVHRIGVLMGSPETYAGLLQEQFKAAGIPVHGPPVRPLGQSMAGRVLTGMLRLPSSEFRRTAVTEWMNAGPIVEAWQGEHAGRPIRAHDWDEISRDAGIVKGANQWPARLKAWRESDRRHSMEIEWATRLDGFVFELNQRLSAPDELSMAGFAGWALSLLDRYLGSETVASKWEKDVEAAAYVEVRKLLQSIAASEQLVDPDTGAPINPIARLARADRLHVFLQALERALEKPSGRLGPFGDGVFIGPIRAARGMQFDHLFVLGMTEGSVPGAVREDPLLPDDDRDVAGLPLRDHRRIEARDDYLAALATAPERVLSAPQSSLREQSKELPSRWLLESASVLAGREISSEDFEAMWDEPWLTAVASFEQAMTSDELPPASEQEWELRSLQRRRDPRSHFLAQEPAFAASVQAMRVRLPRWARRHEMDCGTLSRWAGGVGTGVALQGDRPYSATPFETFAKCPFQYFLKHALYVKETGRPEQIHQIEARERGNIVHRSLERFFVEVQEAGQVPSPATDWSPEQRRRLIAIGEEECAWAHARGLTGGELRWKVDRARILRDLALFLDEDTKERRRTGGTFAGAELAFGTTDAEGTLVEGSWDPLTIELADGSRVSFKGRIDRVDRREDGGLIVYDYKTGQAKDYLDINKGGDPLMAGKLMQLPIYGLAARQGMGDPATPVEGRYWFVSERERFGSVGFPLTSEEEGRLVEVLDVLAGTVKAGYFPQVPGKADRQTFVNCKYCAFDRVCPGGDRVARWEEAQGANELVNYVALIAKAPEVETTGDN